VGAVVLVAAASLLAQPPLGSVPGASATSGVALASAVPAGSAGPVAPLAIVNGTSYWIAGGDGVYQIKGSATDCTAGSGGCTVAGGSTQTLGSITSDSTVSAVLAPDAQVAAVWTDNKIAIVPLASGSQTVALDLLTPRPTTAPTPAITAAPATPAASHAVTASPTAAATAAPSAAASAAPTASARATATATAAATAPTAATPTPAATTATPAGTARAILDGYEIVGPDPQFSADGSIVAFSARPADHSTGPNVFVWRKGDEQAHAISNHGADLFAGWYDGRILVNEIAASDAASATAVSTVSYIVDPRTGEVRRFARPMLVAGIDPTGTYVIYWSGSVEFDTATGLWQPGKGALFFEPMAALELTPASLLAAPSASPTPRNASSASASAPASGSPPSATVSASPHAGAASPSASAAASGAEPSVAPAPSATPAAAPQPLALGTASGVRRWVLRWDAAGANVAIWVADPGSNQVGRISLFAVDRGSAALSPTLAAETVLSSICFDDGKLVYTSALDGRTYARTVPQLPPATPSPTPVPTASAATASAPPSQAVSSARPGA
jgi:hypothetical protein